MPGRFSSLHTFIRHPGAAVRSLFGGGVVNPYTQAQLEPYQLTPHQQALRIRAHLAKRNKSLGPGHPRLFVAVANQNWERDGLVEPWGDLADVEHYDWSDRYDQYAPDWHTAGKRAFNDELLRRVRAAHERQPIDLFFSYLSGRLVYPTTVQALSAMGLITVNFCFDDTLKFWGYRERGTYTGSVQIAPAFDLCITAASPRDVAKYVMIGANPLFLPPGGNPNRFAPTGSPVDIDVSFIGQSHGVRGRMVKQLIDAGIRVQTFGVGWPSGPVSPQRMNDIYSRSLVNLGFGYIAEHLDLVQLKGRDFEAPLCGRLYLTTANPALDGCFRIGREIDCYRDFDDLLRKIRLYLSDRGRALAVGAAGRARCLAEHSWRHRFQHLLDLLRAPGRPPET